MPESAVKLQGVTKIYQVGGVIFPAINSIDLEVRSGEFVVVFGPSGSGKSTILNLIAGLDHPSQGTVTVKGEDLGKMPEKELAAYRGGTIGVVFQQFNLLPNLTVRENVAMPLLLAGVPRTDALIRANEVLEILDLGGKAIHVTEQLSGGEQQRTAIARAMVTNPSILLVDEPTGNVDIQAGEEIVKLLEKVNRKWGRTVILVTHNPEYRRVADRVVHMVGGRIAREDAQERKAAEPKEDDEKLKYFVPRRNGALSAVEAFRFAAHHFFGKWSRSFLTTLGVAMGVGSIVVLVSLGMGLEAITSRQLASLDALVTITAAPNKDSAITLDAESVSKVAATDHVSLVSPTLTEPAKLTYNGSTSDVAVEGIKPEALGFEGISLLTGGPYTDQSGVILSQAAAKALDINQPGSVIGKSLTLNLQSSAGDSVSMSEPIVGISKDELLPAVYLSLAKEQSVTGIGTYSGLKVKVDDRNHVQGVRDVLEKGGYSTSSVIDLINQVDRAFVIAQIALGVIGAVSLIVALLGIINIMVISLLERTHEVGILKAIGATNGVIARIFEYEVFFFGFFGGVAGTAMAWFFGYLVNLGVNYLVRVSGVSMQSSLTLFVTPLLFAGLMVAVTVLTSLVAGLYPARRASRLSPVDALRYE